MTTPTQHADSQIKEITLKSEIARLSIQEDWAEFLCKVTVVAGLVLTAIALVSTL